MPRSTFFTLCQRFLFTYELYEITIITQDFIITSQLFIYIYISTVYMKGMIFDSQKLCFRRYYLYITFTNSM